MRRRLPPIALLLFSLRSLAASPEMVALGSSEEQFFGELPVVVSATRLPQTPLELPASLTTLDRRMIEASGVTDIPELLRLVAGYQIAHVDGSHYAVTYHGMGDDYARRIQVLVDGRSVYMPATSSVDWSNLPIALEDIDRIEVLRGPNGEVFGDNSFTGVINIITLDAAATRGSYLRVQGGQGNYRRVVAREGIALGALDLRVTLQHRSDEGLEDTVIKDRIYSLKDDQLSNKLSLRGDWRAGVNDYLQFFAGYNSGSSGHGYNSMTSNWMLVAQEPGFDARNRRHYQQVKWRHIESSDEETQLQFYHNSAATEAAYQTLSPFPPLLVQMDNHSDRYALELEQRSRLGDTLRAVWGGEARYDEVTAPGYLNQQEPITNQMYRLFAHGEWRPDDAYLVNVGAMAEHNEIAGSHYSPRLAINRRLDGHHALRVSATRAYRTPAIIEEYADYSAKLSSDPALSYPLWRSQGDLKSEKNTAYELGVMGSLADGRTQYDVKLFREELRDLIAYPLWRNYSATFLGPSSPLYFSNDGWANLQGLEWQVKSRTSDDTLLSFGYSYVTTEGEMRNRINPLPGEAPYENVVDNVPSHSFSWLTEHRFDSNWRGTFAMYYVDHIAFWHKTALATADLRVSRRFKSGENEGELTLVARDLLGAYYDYQDERVIKPRLYLSFEYKF